MSSLATLQALAAGLCQDASIVLEASDGNWAWSPTRRALLVPNDAIEKFGAEACAGIVAHEVGHAFLSRYTQFIMPERSKAFVSDLFNALEDPRVELWMSRRYPGSRRWISAAHATTDDGSLPPIPSLQLLLMFVREGVAMGEARALVRPVVANHVARALDATRAARRAYVQDFLPDPSLHDLPDGVHEDYDREVAPALVEEPLVTTLSEREKWMSLVARRAHAHALETIVPSALAVYDADVLSLALVLDHDPSASSIARAVLASGDSQAVFRAVAQVLSHVGSVKADAASSASLAIARQLLDAVFSRRSTDGQPVVAPAPAPSRAAARSGGHGDPRGRQQYEASRAPVSPQIDALVRTLEDVLVPRQRARARAGHGSGPRVSISRVMAFQADRRRPIDFWVRTSVPSRRRAAFSLLVDLSGSMRGKVTHALSATVLFAETLERLGVPFSIDGFQDEVIPVLGFGDRLDHAARARIGSLAAEVSGTRPGGRNQPNYNDDGPCVQAVGQALLERSEEDRVLLVLSDGRPEGRRSNEGDLRAAIDGLSSELVLVGLGIGPGTEHVSEFYPRALASVPLDQLAVRVGGVLRDSLLLAA